MSVRPRASLVCLYAFTAVFQVSVNTQSAPFTVTIQEDSPVQTSRGSNLTMSCHLSTGLQVLLTHDVAWLKQSRVSGLANDSLAISQWARVVVNFPLSEHYRVQATNNAASVTVALTVIHVRDEDDGRYVCRVTNKRGSTVDGEQSIDVIVHNAVEAIDMKVDNNAVTKSSTRLLATEQTVHCTSRGSNPAADLAIYLDNQQLKVNHMDSHVMRQASETARAPRYSVHAEATVELSKADSGKELSCRSEGGMVIATVLAVVDKPTVACSNVTAHHSDMHARLSCVVQHTDVTIEDFVWELDETDAVYSNDVPAQNSTVTAEDLSDRETRVTLTLYVVRWAEGRTRFKLTVITDAGEQSGEAFLTIVPEEEQIVDGSSGDVSSAHSIHSQALAAVFGQLLAVTAVILSFV